MLPTNLEALRQSLKNPPGQGPTQALTQRQSELLNELEVVSKALDQATLFRSSITEDIDHLTKRHTSAWGTDPGRCPVCGK